MRQLFLAAMVSLVVVLVTAGAALAQPKPEFKMGFKALADQFTAIVGEAV